MVGQLPLEQPIGVRIPGGQPTILFLSLAGASYGMIREDLEQTLTFTVAGTASDSTARKEALDSIDEKAVKGGS
jgi:hypothetical protein